MDFKNLTLKEKAEVYRILAEIERNLTDRIESDTKEMSQVLNNHLDRVKNEAGYEDSWEATYALGQVDDKTCAIKAMRVVLEYLNK